MPKYTLLSLLFLILGCSSNVENREPAAPITIDIETALTLSDEIKASDFVESFEYIPLEFSDKTLIRALRKPQLVGDSLVLVTGFRRLALFNRTSGVYIKDIGHYGNDPGGYRNTVSDLGFNAENYSVYAKGWKPEYLEYSLESGEIIDKIIQPSNTNNDDINAEIFVSSSAKLTPNLYIGYQSNLSGNQPNLLMTYNAQGEIQRFFKNHQSFAFSGSFSVYSDEGKFHHYNNQVYFKEQFNDTLFLVNKDTLQAQYIFQLGDKSPPYAKKSELDYDTEVPNYVFLNDLVETGEGLIFTASYRKKQRIGVYHKKRQRVQISNYDIGNELTLGMVNDIDGFIPFYPTDIQGDYLIGLTSAEDIALWFEQNPDKIASLPPTLQALQNIDPEANPVVMIGKVR